MKVHELIDRLQQCQPNLEVTVCYTSDNPLTDDINIVNLFQITNSIKENDNKVVLHIGG